jgi:alpha-ketoglutarate-dependent taurine dioxygenase
VNRHPSTGEPSWFCNVHSHSRYLRDGRDGELGETTGASKLNVTDMFYGDGTPIPAEDLDHINEVYMKNLVYVPMSEGDVVLVDNYQVMHGRDVFTGERLHAVTWFQ